MSEYAKIKDDIMPSATPSDDEVQRWQKLPRDEQLSRMQKILQEAMQSGTAEQSMDEIKAAAMKRLATRENG